MGKPKIGGTFKYLSTNGKEREGVCMSVYWHMSHRIYMVRARTSGGTVFQIPVNEVKEWL